MIIRESNKTDKDILLQLYANVSKNKKGIARLEKEISETYINTILNCSIHGGINLLGFKDDVLIAEIHASKYGIEIFNHILTGLTIVIHQEYQGKGYGRQIFKALLSTIENT